MRKGDKRNVKKLTDKQKNTITLALIIGLVAIALLVFWISTAGRWRISRKQTAGKNPDREDIGLSPNYERKNLGFVPRFSFFETFPKKIQDPLDNQYCVWYSIIQETA